MSQHDNKQNKLYKDMVYPRLKLEEMTDLHRALTSAPLNNFKMNQNANCTPNFIMPHLTNALVGE